MKPTFFFDIDDVLLDTQRYYWQFLGLEKQTFDTRVLQSIPKKRFYDFRRSEYFSKIPPLVSSNIFNLISSKYPVRLITNIPQYCLLPRLQNLTDIGYNFTSIDMAGPERSGTNPAIPKSTIIDNYLDLNCPALFFDDSLLNCIDVLSKFRNQCQVVLFDRPHNRSQSLPKEIERATGWCEILRIIRRFLGLVE